MERHRVGLPVNFFTLCLFAGLSILGVMTIREIFIQLQETPQHTPPAGRSQNITNNLTSSDLVKDQELPGINLEGGIGAKETPVPAVVNTTTSQDIAPSSAQQNSDAGSSQLPVYVAPEQPTPAPLLAVYPEWTVQYFCNTQCNGKPSQVSSVPRVAVKWDEGDIIPHHNIKEWFSTRWATQLALPEGEYNFVLAADDWAELSINENVILSDGHNHHNSHAASNRYKLWGDRLHRFQIDYTQYTNEAFLYFYWEPALDHPCWYGTYFDSLELYGKVIGTLQLEEENLVVRWSPQDPSIDRFSARWSRNCQITQSGTYQLCIYADGGTRIWVDRERPFNEWHAGEPRVICKEMALSADDHNILIEHFSNGSELMFGFWQDRIVSDSSWSASYYNNTDLTGIPAIVRSDSDVYFNWQTGSPAPEVNADRFSVRWKREMQLEAGNYHFYLQVDDGARLKINGVTVIDVWSFDSNQSISTTYTSFGETVTLEIEYFENTGNAGINFWIEKPLRP